jgi:anion transporter
MTAGSTASSAGGAAAARSGGVGGRAWAAGVLLALGGAGALVMVRSGAVEPSSPSALAGVLVLLAVAAWAWGGIPEHLVSLAFFAAAVLFSVAPASVVFSGFASSAIWLIFGGQAVGIAIRHTGLAVRIADATVRRIGSRSYPAVIGGVVLVGALLAFVMPSSMGRVVLLLPIAGAIADRYGFEGPGNGRTGVLLAAVFGTHIPSFAVLPANVPNAILAGLAETHGITLGYVEYFVLHFPVLGLLRGALLVGLIVLLHPARLVPRDEPAKEKTPLTGKERALAALLALCLGLWATDFLHHVPAAWIALAAGLVVLLPWARLVPERAFQDHMNHASLFFVAGLIGAGAVIVHSGLGEALGRAVERVVPFAPGHGAWNFAALAATGTVLAIFTTAPGLPTVMTPLAGSLSSATGMSVEAVLHSQVIAFSNNVLPYQAPPLVVASQISSLPAAATLRLLLVLAAVTTVVLVPLDYVWWRALGWVG